MMSRKDYIKVSEVIKFYKSDMTEQLHRDLVNEFSDIFSEDNKNFDSIRFATACGLEVELI
jgi:hypothetical protein